MGAPARISPHSPFSLLFHSFLAAPSLFIHRSVPSLTSHRHSYGILNVTLTMAFDPEDRIRQLTPLLDKPFFATQRKNILPLIAHYSQGGKLSSPDEVMWICDGLILGSHQPRAICPGLPFSESSHCCMLDNLDRSRLSRFIHAAETKMPCHGLALESGSRGLSQ
jgi:hypothetical protein